MSDDLIVDFIRKSAKLFDGRLGEDNAVRHYFFDERFAK